MLRGSSHLVNDRSCLGLSVATGRIDAELAVMREQ
jgi:hypothetical protein